MKGLKLVKEIGCSEAVFLAYIHSLPGHAFEGYHAELEEIFGKKYSSLRRLRRKLERMGYIRSRKVGFPPRLRVELTEKGLKLFSCSGKR